MEAQKKPLNPNIVACLNEGLFAELLSITDEEIQNHLETYYPPFDYEEKQCIGKASPLEAALLVLSAKYDQLAGKARTDHDRKFLLGEFIETPADEIKNLSAETLNELVVEIFEKMEVAHEKSERFLEAANVYYQLFAMSTHSRLLESGSNDGDLVRVKICPKGNLVRVTEKEFAE